MMAWGWRSVFAVIAALLFFGFAGFVVAAMPQTTQTGCYGRATGASYTGGVWSGRDCSSWYSWPSGAPHTYTAAYRMRPITGWTVLEHPIGIASGFHQLIFEAALALAAWFAAFGCLSVAVAIPVNRRAPITPSLPAD